MKLSLLATLSLPLVANAALDDSKKIFSLRGADGTPAVLADLDLGCFKDANGDCEKAKYCYPENYPEVYKPQNNRDNDIYWGVVEEIFCCYK